MGVFKGWRDPFLFISLFSKKVTAIALFLCEQIKKKFDFFLQMRYNKNNESKILRD